MLVGEGLEQGRLFTLGVARALMEPSILGKARPREVRRQWVRSRWLTRSWIGGANNDQAA
jgi:hypothetical protein